MDSSIQEGSKKESGSITEVINLSLICLVIAVVVFNQVQINKISSSVSGLSVNPIKKTLSKATSLFTSSKDGKIIGPMLNSDGRST